jgi:hypothetical protein
MVPILTGSLLRLPSYGLPSQLVLHAKTAGAKAAIPAFHEELLHLLSTTYANTSSLNDIPSYVATVSVIGLGYSVCAVAAIAIDRNRAASWTTVVVGPFAIVVAVLAAPATATTIVFFPASEAECVAA